MNSYMKNSPLLPFDQLLIQLQQEEGQRMTSIHILLQPPLHEYLAKNYITH